MGPIRTLGVLAAPLVQPSGQLCVASEPRGTHEDQHQGLLDVHRQVIRRLIADGEQVCPMLIVRLGKRAWHCRLVSRPTAPKGVENVGTTLSENRRGQLADSFGVHLPYVRFICPMSCSHRSIAENIGQLALS